MVPWGGNLLLLRDRTWREVSAIGLWIVSRGKEGRRPRGHTLTSRSILEVLTPWKYSIFRTRIWYVLLQITLSSSRSSRGRIQARAEMDAHPERYLNGDSRRPRPILTNPLPQLRCRRCRTDPERAILAGKRKAGHFLPRSPGSMTEPPQFDVSCDLSQPIPSHSVVLILPGNGPDVSSGPCATCTIYSVECTYNDRLKVLSDSDSQRTILSTKSQSSGPRRYGGVFAVLQGLRLS